MNANPQNDLPKSASNLSGESPRTHQVKPEAASVDEESVTQNGNESDQDEPRSVVTFSLISHTNVGKTTLARTLLRRDVGDVLDREHVTDTNQRHSMLERSVMN